MAEIDQGGPAIADSVRGRVVDPIAAAERTIAREREEVESERRAFERFRERVEAVDAASTSTNRPPMRTITVDDPSRRADAVRTAFRETVMAVPHYDDVYGEPLEVHFASEFPAEAVVTVRPDGQPFTEASRDVLTAATDRAIRQRAIFCDALDDERDSLAVGRSHLEDVLDDYERLRDVERSPTDRLDEIARDRQAFLRGRESFPGADGHEACSYLYQDEPWTYPLLTAVTRLRAALE